MLYFRARRKSCLQPDDIHKRIKPFPAAWKFLKETVQQTQQQCISSAKKDLEKEKIMPGWLFSKAKDGARNQKVFYKMLYRHKENEKPDKFWQCRCKKYYYEGQARVWEANSEKNKN